jgi:hypothetical protein
MVIEPGSTTKTTKPSRTSAGLWSRGSSGNPAGRSNLSVEFRRWCQAIAPVEVQPRLLEVLRDPQHRFHFQAIEMVISYAYGKPSQQITIGQDPDAIELQTLSLADIRIAITLQRDGGIDASIDAIPTVSAALIDGVSSAPVDDTDQSTPF